MDNNNLPPVNEPNNQVNNQVENPQYNYQGGSQYPNQPPYPQNRPMSTKQIIIIVICMALIGLFWQLIRIHYEKEAQLEKQAKQAQRMQEYQQREYERASRPYIISLGPDSHTKRPTMPYSKVQSIQVGMSVTDLNAYMGSYLCFLQYDKKFPDGHREGKVHFLAYDGDLVVFIYNNQVSSVQYTPDPDEINNHEFPN